MSNCPLCGKRIVASRGNCTIIDGQMVHKRCPIDKPKISKEDSENFKKLTDKVSYYLVHCPRGYVVDTGLNFRKVIGQIRTLKDKGYSYKDQLYALDKIVEMQDGFWGYTSVVNKIDFVIGKKREKDKIIENYKNTKVQEKPLDLSSLIIDDSEEEW